ncbi:MAG: tyrosine-type recombinase/integrase [Candidatus Aminicenantes bacterium]|nr:MAG: tyrosine-type recombinase/integrase [Candidatus Aminicenantes bacterium]
MAVRKHGKYYQIDYYVGRRRIREILKGVTTKREAEEIERERLRNSTGPIEYKRFEGLARWFLTHPDKQSKKTLDRDLQRFGKHLLPYFGHCKPHDINSSMVDDYKVRRQRQFAANATINRELALLKSIFRFALKKGKVSRVPQIDLLPEDNVRQRFVTEEEIQKILPFLSGDVLPIVVIAYHTAMRLGEILGLCWKNIDLKRRLFLFETEKSKARKQRAVALHPEIIKMFQSMPRGFGETPVFNLKRDRVERAWQKACRKAGVKDAWIHDFRRTRATIWHKEEGLPQDLIMHMTGHRTDSMFRRYQIVSTEYVEKLAQKWSDTEQNGKERPIK